MTQIFADTSYWIALLSPRDELHAAAAKLSGKISAARIVTSEMVLTELLNGFSEMGRLWRLAAVKAVEDILGSPAIEVVPQAGLFEKALAQYKRFADKSWSVTDCASFMIMESYRIESALTHDQHFVQAGFQALLR